MATVAELLAGSLRLLGALDPGEAMDGVTALQAFQVLNEVVEAFNLEHLLNPTGLERVDVTCTAGQQVHTIGASGNWNVSRPVAIERAYVVIGTAEYPISVLDDAEWGEIHVKGVQGIPQALFYEPSAPLGKVYLWPKPAIAYSLALWAWDSLPAFTALSQTVTLPPAYAKLLRYRVAIELAPEFGKTPNPVVMQVYTDTLAAIKRVNLITPTLEVDDAFMQTGGNSGTNMAGFLAGN